MMNWMRRGYLESVMLMVTLLLHLMAAQQGNDLNQLLRGSQQAVNSHASSYAPGTQMFEEAHKSWLPKLPQRDSSGLPESTSAEQLTGASFMSQPDQISKTFRNTDIIAGGSQNPRL